MTYGEFADCLDGYRDRMSAYMKMQDELNHQLGKYIAFSFHEPKKYPKDPATTVADNESKKKHVATTNAQRQRYARIRYGGGK